MMEGASLQEKVAVIRTPHTHPNTLPSCQCHIRLRSFCSRSFGSLFGAPSFTAATLWVEPRAGLLMSTCAWVTVGGQLGMQLGIYSRRVGSCELAVGAGSAPRGVAVGVVYMDRARGHILYDFSLKPLVGPTPPTPQRSPTFPVLWWHLYRDEHAQQASREPLTARSVASHCCSRC